MTLRIIDSGSTDRLVSAFKIIDAGSVDRTISEARLIDMNGVDRIVYSTAIAFSADVDPALVTGIVAGGSTATTDLTLASPTGGTAPYTYAWTLIAHDHPTNAPTANDPTLSATDFTQTGIGPGEAYSATFRCTITDANSQTASADLTAVFLDNT